jgi:hypothetical protein
MISPVTESILRAVGSVASADRGMSSFSTAGAPSASVASATNASVPPV